VEGENDPLVIVQAAENYPLTTLTLPVINVKASDRFWLKENRYSLYNMFEAHKMNMKELIDESFVGGTIYQGFLSPWCYHWWHAPVSGTVEKCYLLPGSYFLQNPSYDLNEVNNYDNSQPFLSCVSVRQVIVIDTHNPRVGRVALIEIGMVEVSTCVCLVK
jgi:phosphatidylserine decarboxylase